MAFRRWPSLASILTLILIAITLWRTYLGAGSTWIRHHLRLYPGEPIVKSKNVKNIILYTPFFGWSDWGFGFGVEPFTRHCHRSDCSVTDDPGPNGVADFDAVLFHLSNIEKWTRTNFAEANIGRHSDQRYVLYSLESPQMATYTEYTEGGFFNWTMSYRVDSDIYAPYGQIIPEPSTPAEDSVDSRPGLVSWLVSNCNAFSDREKYVSELRRYIQVDIYGRCGTPCKDSECMNHIYGDYKFYLSFENSVCVDYVTEKFFKPLAAGAIPIVMGGANYSSFAPPNSYVDVNHFASPRDLAKHLREVAENPKLYARYTQWRKRGYKIISGPEWTSLGFCSLCEALHDETRPTKSYQHLINWFATSSGGHTMACMRRGALPWSHYYGVPFNSTSYSPFQRAMLAMLGLFVGLTLAVACCLQKLEEESRQPKSIGLSNVGLEATRL